MVVNETLKERFRSKWSRHQQGEGARRKRISMRKIRKEKTQTSTKLKKHSKRKKI